MNRVTSPRNECRESVSPTAPPQGKYIPYHERFPIKLPDRTWPDKQILKAPDWCSVDLRDANQALEVPMTVEEKMGFFHVLKRVGFRQIEVGYPASGGKDMKASAEYIFLRKLIEEKTNGRPNLEGVIPQVLTMDRADLIKATFESLKGAPGAIVHIYRPTSIDQRELFFRMTKDQVMQAAVDSTKLVRRLAMKADFPVQLQFSPESFTGTEIDFAIDVCNAVVNAWDPASHERVILNLPATVELSRPNLFADRIEYFCRKIKRRENVIISLHNHNDRGTAVAATELGLLAGGQRVEGTLFGNGERTGNLDILNLAINLYKEGIDPELDLRHIPEVAAAYKRYVKMPIPARHVVGDYAFVAFSGGHQGPISAGLEYREENPSQPEWRVPYLGVDPEDLGISYEPISLNSQSGKHGAMFNLKRHFGIHVPKMMGNEVGAMMKSWTIANPKEGMSREKLIDVFTETFVTPKGEIQVKDHSLNREGMRVSGRFTVYTPEGGERTIIGEGNGPIDAAMNALKSIGYEFNVTDFQEQGRGTGSDAEAVAFVKVSNGEVSAYGVGINNNLEGAAVEAFFAAANRLTQRFAGEK
jgi:2-isopropylmalate synthase